MKSVRRAWMTLAMAAFFAIVIFEPCLAAAPEERSERSFWVEEVLSGLSFPWAMVWLPDGDWLITERPGRLRRVHQGKLLPEALSGVPAVFANHVDGLLDIALDPDFASNHLLYISLTEGSYESRHASVYRGYYSDGGLTRLQRVFRSKDDIRGIGPIAGRMMFLPDKTLLVAVTESQAYRHLAQRPDSHIGKLIRINRDGSVPNDNPFLGKADTLPEIYSLGHRNPSGIYGDPATSQAWVLDIGPMGGDELNVLSPGANYGWPAVSWGSDYSGKPISDRQSAPEYEDPILVWSPSSAATPSGLTQYHGNAFPEWRDDLLMGNLAGKRLRRVRIREGIVVLDESLLTDLGERIRSVYVGPDGLPYLLTDHVNGRLLRLHPGGPSETQLTLVARKQAPTPPPPISADRDGMLTADFADGDRERGRALFTQMCTACHGVGREIEGGEIGPNLAGVYGRRVGSMERFSYSKAMAAARSQLWDRVTINLFLANPAGFFPGTAMTGSPVSNPQDRRDIVGFLKSVSQ